MEIRELSCMGNHGNVIHGTAALLHRIFCKDGFQTVSEHGIELHFYEAVIEALGYASFHEEIPEDVVCSTDKIESNKKVETERINYRKYYVMRDEACQTSSRTA